MILATAPALLFHLIVHLPSSSQQQWWSAAHLGWQPVISRENQAKQCVRACMDAHIPTSMVLFYSGWSLWRQLFILKSTQKLHLKCKCETLAFWNEEILGFGRTCKIHNYTCFRCQWILQKFTMLFLPFFPHWEFLLLETFLLSNYWWDFKEATYYLRWLVFSILICHLNMKSSLVG